MIPTVFKYNVKNGNSSMDHVTSTVYISGSMTEWRSREMAALKDECSFLAIIDCWPGKYFYKFWVDGKWCHDESQPVMISKDEVIISDGSGYTQTRKYPPELDFFQYPTYPNPTFQI